MRITILALAMMIGLVGAAPLMAQDAGQAWIQLEAHPDLTTSEENARIYARTQDNVAGFRIGEKWYVLALGPYDPAQAAGEMANLKSIGVIPQDAYITDGLDHGPQFWPVGSAQDVTQTEPAAPAPTVPAAPAVPDETPEQARAAESALTSDARAELQTALAWYGFYDAKVDGSFGKGTRTSMAAWQTAFGFEPTGVLTTLQRTALVQNYQADQAEFGFETLNEPEAGIEIAVPAAMVTFDHYEPPFVHFAAKNGSKLRLVLMSEPGDAQALAGLFDVLQTLDVMPSTGDRALQEDHFSIQGSNDKVASFAYAELKNGAIKGYLVTWEPAIADKMTRILPALEASFRSVGEKYLDPGLVPLDEAARTGLLAGMQIKRPSATASGIFVDKDGSVLTDANTVAQCGRITLDGATEADVIAADQGVAVLKPQAPLAPAALAPISNQMPQIGAPILAAGYSNTITLPGAVLSRGALAAATDLDGDAGRITLSVTLNSGDMGGPVLDETGALLGMITAAPADKILPKGTAMAISAAVLAQILADNGISSPAVQTVPLTVDAINAAAIGMTTQVACWP